MPELPEVEWVKRLIKDNCVGKVLEKILAPPDNSKPEFVLEKIYNIVSSNYIYIIVLKSSWKKIINGESVYV